MQAIEMLKFESSGMCMHAYTSCMKHAMITMFIIDLSIDEKQTQTTEIALRRLLIKQLDGQELIFWKKTIADTLQPIPEGLTRATELKKSLDNLRNSTLIAMFVINLIWIMLF